MGTGPPDRHRFVLGLGTQVRAHVERRFATAFDRPVARLRDYVGALRAILVAFGTGEPLRYAGEFYEFSLLPEFFRPAADPGSGCRSSWLVSTRP